MTSLPTIPQVLVFKSADDHEFSYSIVEYKEGILLSDIIVEDKNILKDVYFELGLSLAEFLKIKFEREGMLNENLKIIVIDTKHTIFHPKANFIMDCLENNFFQKRIDRTFIKKIQNLIILNEKLLNEIEQTSHLVHGDLKIENIIVRREDEKIHLVAILDWEYARLDTTYADIATLFRGDYDQNTVLKRAFTAGFESTGECLISSWDREDRIF